MQNHSKPRLYYAHPITSYRTEEERRIIKALSQDYELVNPGAHVIDGKNPQAEYARYKAEGAAGMKVTDPLTGEERTRQGMDYFFELVEGCDTLALSTFEDGSLGLGVAREAELALKQGKTVFHAKIDEAGHVVLEKLSSLESFKVLNLEETRTMIAKIRYERDELSR